MNKFTAKNGQNLIKLFLCGDVMTGRGIDQLLPYPGDPVLYEPFIRDARDYIELAEATVVPIPHPVDFGYIWGDALAELERAGPDVRIINLETSITSSNAYIMNKSIHYRMNPRNIPCLTAAGIDYCSLANNHVMDWGYTGLIETLETLEKTGIRHAGAGADINSARSPAILSCKGKGSVLVFSFGSHSSGIPFSWMASEAAPGINLLPDYSESTVASIKKEVDRNRQPDDIVVASIHWGGNWGYEIPREHQKMAHVLIDQAGADIIHGHSSHHIKGIEAYKNKLILYGCGDFLNDYEGIHSHEIYRGELGLMYFATIYANSGELANLEMVPMLTRAFRVNRAQVEDTKWIANTLSRECRKLGNDIEMLPDNSLRLLF